MVSVQREGLNLVVLYGNIERDFPMSCLHTHFTRVDDPGGGGGGGLISNVSSLWSI